MKQSRQLEKTEDGDKRWVRRLRGRHASSCRSSERKTRTLDYVNSESLIRADQDKCILARARVIRACRHPETRAHPRTCNLILLWRAHSCAKSPPINRGGCFFNPAGDGIGRIIKRRNGDSLPRYDTTARTIIHDCARNASRVVRANPIYTGRERRCQATHRCVSH